MLAITNYAHNEAVPHEEEGFMRSTWESVSGGHDPDLTTKERLINTAKSAKEIGEGLKGAYDLGKDFFSSFA